MVVRCGGGVSEIGELRSQDGEVGESSGPGVQSIPVTTGKTGNDYRYSGTVITVYIGNKMVYAGESVTQAIDRICQPGGVEYEVCTL